MKIHVSVKVYEVDVLDDNSMDEMVTKEAHIKYSSMINTCHEMVRVAILNNCSLIKTSHHNCSHATHTLIVCECIKSSLCKCMTCNDFWMKQNTLTSIVNYNVIDRRYYVDSKNIEELLT